MKWKFFSPPLPTMATGKYMKGDRMANDFCSLVIWLRILLILIIFNRKVRIKFLPTYHTEGTSRVFNSRISYRFFNITDMQKFYINLNNRKSHLEFLPTSDIKAAENFHNSHSFFYFFHSWWKHPFESAKVRKIATWATSIQLDMCYLHKCTTFWRAHISTWFT